jgi:hypothetical protein
MDHLHCIAEHPEQVNGCENILFAVRYWQWKTVVGERAEGRRTRQKIRVNDLPEESQEGAQPNCLLG